jgi:hypothetical protein
MTQLTRPTDQLTELTEQWKAAKHAEAQATACRIAIESRIYELTQAELPEKGTHTLPTGMKVTTGWTEEWDQERVTAASQAWPQGLKFPFAGVWKPDGKAISYLRDNAPDAYALLRDAVTLKPKKPAFSLKD